MKMPPCLPLQKEEEKFKTHTNNLIHCPNLESNQEPRHFTTLLVTRSTIEPLGRLVVVEFQTYYCIYIVANN